MDYRIVKEYDYKRDCYWYSIEKRVPPKYWFSFLDFNTHWSYVGDSISREFDVVKAMLKRIKVTDISKTVVYEECE